MPKRLLLWRNGLETKQDESFHPFPITLICLHRCFLLFLMNRFVWSFCRLTMSERKRPRLSVTSTTSTHTTTSTHNIHPRHSPPHSYSPLAHSSHPTNNHLNHHHQHHMTTTPTTTTIIIVVFTSTHLHTPHTIHWSDITHPF